MTYDNQFINGKTKAEKGMWPAQGQAAIMIEHDLNSRETEHPRCTIPGTPPPVMFYGVAPPGPLELSPQWPFGALMDFAVCYTFLLDPQRNIEEGQVHHIRCPIDSF